MSHALHAADIRDLGGPWSIGCCTLQQSPVDSLKVVPCCVHGFHMPVLLRPGAERAQEGVFADHGKSSGLSAGHINHSKMGKPHVDNLHADLHDVLQLFQDFDVQLRCPVAHDSRNDVCTDGLRQLRLHVCPYLPRMLKVVHDVLRCGRWNAVCFASLHQVAHHLPRLRDEHCDLYPAGMGVHACRHLRKVLGDLLSQESHMLKRFQVSAPVTLSHR
mmetsp:Transcript_1317/g.3385  ORF Transcript_1317/g.3385 Transcript_1317/m.3385 type:complete len:217 (-) Transcript_1317:682-1332(-)